MFARARQNPVLWLIAGVVIGMVLSGSWPQAPLHATATAQGEKFAIATGPVDEESEGVFFLDYLTGNLKCAVVSPLTGTFLSVLETNILEDMQVDPTKSPRFLMVTGNNAYRRLAGAPQWALTTCYVAEVNSGKCIAYGVPWGRQRNQAISPIQGPLIKLDMFMFRDAVIRDSR
ncbi:MAG: hypothetical protein AB7I37_05815 [Pirellulales bacterium]